MSRIPFLIEQMEQTRAYSRQVLAHTNRRRWFVMPGGAKTHIAWHLGHLVFAQYSHFMLMICGEEPADQNVIPKERYFALFAKGTAPSPEVSTYPPADEIAAYHESLHAHCMKKFAAFPEEQLLLPTLRPHQIARTRLDMAMWSIKHEMLHTGQIALLRRMLGETPWR